MKLKQKIDTLDAFKMFKSFVENQLDAKIKALQDNKGGEYMSNMFIKFTDECGIHRRHTTRNRPQQNGVAERANRTMAEDISAMLYQAQLPPSFWGEALAAQIHIWNHLPTSSLERMTPHEAWFKRKPDISHLRVWGCLAYVYVQKDKRCSLQPHMEKCEVVLELPLLVTVPIVPDSGMLTLYVALSLILSTPRYVITPQSHHYSMLCRYTTALSLLHD